MRETITISDIRTEDGNQVLIELSDGRIILLTVTEILKAIVSHVPN